MVNTLDTKNGNQELENLKQYFEKVIDSRRIFEKIQSLDDLIRILYKRDCDLQELSNQLKIINDNKTVCNESVSLNISPQQRIVPQLVLQSCRINPQPVLLEQRIDARKILPNVPQDPIERIDQLIADEIGQKWMDLARNLKIPEGKIDEFSNFRLSETIREILKYHRNSEIMWKTSLCTALCNARRKDLCIEVQKILELY